MPDQDTPSPAQTDQNSASQQPGDTSTVEKKEPENLSLNGKPALQNTSADQVKTRLKTLVELGGFAVVLLVAINALLIYFASNQITLFKTNKQQISAALYNSSDLQNTVSFLETQKQQTDLITQSLPNEVGFIDFVKTLELISSQHGRDSRLGFDRGLPDQNLAYVPVTISMTTDKANLSEFLKKTEKLAYLFHIYKIEMNTVSVENDLWSVRIDARVYVSKNFRLNNK